MKKMKKLLSLVLAVVMMFSLAACSGKGEEKQEGSGDSGDSSDVTIGISVSDLRLERWQKDVDLMTNAAKAQGAKVEVASANADEQLQVSQCENLISKGVDILIIVAQNSEALASTVADAHDAGIKVIAYERLLMNCDVDYYVTFDPIAVGEAQAQSLIDLKPTGKYFLLGGSPTDNNAKIYREGQMNVLQPLIDKGDIEVVGDQWVKDWDTDEAFNIVENGLTANNNDIDAIVASNDSTAQGSAQAVAGQDLQGQILISGQDADLVSCQYIVEGLQTSTVYKPLPKLAEKAIEVAMALINGEELKGDTTMNNGKIDVPSTLIDVVSVTKDNMMDTVIADGFQTYEDVYKNVPESERPEK